MLSPSDESFIAEVDLPSLRQTAEEVAQPHSQVVSDMVASFTDVHPTCGHTRVILGHEIAKAEDMSSLVRLVRLLVDDPGGTLAALGRALLADESSGRPSADIVTMRLAASARPAPAASLPTPGKARA